jgi:hypothetical protein
MRAMDTYTFTTHLCASQNEFEATENDMLLMVEGLGNNNIKCLGEVELGKSLRIFLRDMDNKPVGGIVADLFRTYGGPTLK